MIFRYLLHCEKKILNPKAANIKKIALYNYNIPKSYYIGHDDLLTICNNIPDFKTKLKACALNPDLVQLSMIRDEIRNLYLDYNYNTICENFLASNKNTHDWIIRSAFNCEDETKSAFAGNFLSKPIFKPDARNLFKNVLDVLSSFFEPEAFLNILSAGLNPLRVNYGLLIQNYIHGQISGIGFSRDPHALDDFLYNKSNLNGFSEWAKSGCEVLTQGEVLAGRCDFNSQHPGDLLFKNKLNLCGSKIRKIFSSPGGF